MGSAFSSATTPARGRNTGHVASERETMNTDAILDTNSIDSNEEFQDAADEDETRAKAKEEEMNEFKKQLSIKRELRKEILTRHRTEKEALEKSLHDERVSKDKLYENNQQLRELLIANDIEIPDNIQSSTDTSEFTSAIHEMREGFEKLKSDNNKLRRDLVDANSSLQSAYSDIADLNDQNTESMKHISALKDVVAVSRTMIGLREGQLDLLKNKLNEIERSLSDREANILSNDLRQEYERQLQNIRTLRGLYEERARIADGTQQGLHGLFRSSDLADKVEALEEKVEKLEDIIEDKNIEISTYQDETNGTKAEMAVVNKLFSQVLLGYKTKQDLDKLVHRLEENHGLLTHMAENENDSEASSALPKLLLKLVSEVDEIEEQKTENDEESEKLEEAVLAPESSPTTSTAEEIVENLPKVWRVLMELLSHQAVVEDTAEKITTCYKLVETKSGPVEVPSVSQTYIRLKDLIVEKLGLVKEVNRMKQLNTHLENRLQEQEKRLCLVTTELGKTWHVVGKLRRHHYQLHTHEKILKYELQQKRKLLNELKEELEYCREKWDEAREKNSQSERDWIKLRAEFTSRKTKSGSPSFNNSAESGYSDERPSDESSESNDESEYVAEHPFRCKKKMKKSFETILDSSTDFNCAAEREDPVSDMLDVADLPLDTHDGDNHGATTSECSKSENVFKSEKTCETEDEICEITHDDSLVEEHAVDDQISDDNVTEMITSNTEISSLQSEPNTSSFNTPSENVQLTDPTVILMNVRKQNERLAKKDERLQNLEKNSSALLKKTQETTQISQEINSTLDHLLSRPTYINNKQNTDTETETDVEIPATGNSNLLGDSLNPQLEQNKENNIVSINENNEEVQSSVLKIENGLPNNSDGDVTENNTNAPVSTNPKTPLVGFKTAMENELQNEFLSKKDESLDNLEKGCSEIVSNSTCTLSTNLDMIEKLGTPHHNNKDDTVEASGSDCLTEFDNSIDKESEPTTSTEADHEARFAARDIRLKRLEEQTKSLVNKVNKTNSKGVKIHYKLQELHNIYGSESSRAGTPSEDSADRSNDEDNDLSEKNR
ncbi:putative Ofd1 protein [Operophtera brumata]|uniref:Putative Ofd1 protein n=1 Tax=Operophtera brumata TaxID=104452 RepID=A0A0L7LBC8_OPEBR|nr:putative Ofd1 protein [Operophtera brumata]